MYGYANALAVAEAEGLPVDTVSETIISLSPTIFEIFGATVNFYKTEDYETEAKAVFGVRTFTHGLELSKKQAIENNLPNLRPALEALDQAFSAGDQTKGLSYYVKNHLLKKKKVDDEL